MDDNAGFCFEIKQECKDDLLEVVDNLKQEEPTEQTHTAVKTKNSRINSVFALIALIELVRQVL